MDVPNYSFSPRAAGVRGFTGIAPAAKWEFQGLPEGLQVSVVAGAGLPTGPASNGGDTTRPYLQLPWSQEIGGDFSLHGMVTQTWIPGQGERQNTRRKRCRWNASWARQPMCSWNMSATIPVMKPPARC